MLALATISGFSPEPQRGDMTQVELTSVAAETPMMDLLAAARANRVQVAMNAYPDSGAARYVMLDGSTLA